MPAKVLNCGALIYFDEEDADLVDGRSWHVNKQFPTNSLRVAATERRYGRMYRVTLHREVALRIRPEILTRKLKFRAVPRNGDFLDCRRENIEIRQVAAHRRGRKGVDPRPQGWERVRATQPKLDQRPASPLWAGGYELKLINRVYKGEGYRVRRCIAGKPVD